MYSPLPDCTCSKDSKSTIPDFQSQRGKYGFHNSWKTSYVEWDMAIEEVEDGREEFDEDYCRMKIQWQGHGLLGMCDRMGLSFCRVENWGNVACI